MGRCLRGRAQKATALVPMWKGDVHIGMVLIMAMAVALPTVVACGSRGSLYPDTRPCAVLPMQLAHAAGVPVFLDAGGVEGPIAPELLACL